MTNFKHIMDMAVDRLTATISTYAPPLIAAAIIFAAFFVVAVAVRWIVARITKSTRVDRFLAQSGFGDLTSSGMLPTARVVSLSVYWLILLAGALTALSVFDTSLTSRMIESVVFLLPKMLTAAVIVTAGLWLGRHFSRSVLMWGNKEKVPYARAIAAIIRVLTILVAVMIAADHLDFARSAFLVAFIVLVGGVVLCLAIGIGLGAQQTINRHILGISFAAKR